MKLVRENPAEHKVVVADAHPLIRAAIVDLLQADGLVVCAAVDNAAEVMPAVLREQPAATLIDLALPGASGVISQLCRAVPTHPVIAMTGPHTDDQMLRILRAGAAGYLVKDMDPTRLPRVVRATIRGETALPRAFVTRIVRELQHRAGRQLLASDGSSVVLTPRELQILDLLAAGQSTESIAADLALSAVTVRRHICCAIQKLRVPDRASALALLLDGTA